MGEKPDWEVYPFEGGVGRCDMQDTDKLVSMIEQGLINIEKNNIKREKNVF